MLGDKICHVRHAAVAQFYVVIVVFSVVVQLQIYCGSGKFAVEYCEAK